MRLPRNAEMIAHVLRGLGEDGAHCFDDFEDQQAIAERFLDALQARYPTLDRARFLAMALGVGEDSEV